MAACLALAVGCGDDTSPPGGEGGIGGEAGEGGSGGDGGDGGTGGEGEGGSGGEGEGGSGGEGGEGGCTPRTCEEVGATCGTIDDGCGETIVCGTCEDGQVCGEDNTCHCVPQTDAELCAAVGAECGGVVVIDRCGTERMIASCGGCGENEICADRACVCVPETDEELCAAAGAACGSIAVTDRCGEERTVESCGGCEENEVCSDENECVCVGENDAELCAAAGAVCGSIVATDRCGVARTVESCGTCGPDLACSDNACVCVPETDEELCAAAGAACGAIDVTDRCGTERTVASCGTCGPYQACEANACVCVGETDAQLCAAAHAVCGSLTVTDRCGEERAIESCGTCQDGWFCTDEKICACRPETDAQLCAAVGAVCGSITVTDTCGNQRTVESCGGCGEGEACSDANQCVCAAESDAELCAAAEAECGSITVTDRCGVERTIAECGGCAEPATCGAGNVCICEAQTDGELCAVAAATCGLVEVFDACGAQRLIDCGSCDDGLCGGAGVPNTCGPAPMWSTEYPAPIVDLTGVFAFGRDDAWLIGEQGTIVHHRGTSQTAYPTGTRAILHDIWGSGPADLWVVGNNGTLLRFNGLFWRQVHAPGEAFHSVAGHGPGDVWVVAEEADAFYLLHLTESGWEREDLPDLQPGERIRQIRAVGDEIWAVGSAGLVARRGADGWTAERAGTSEYAALWGSSPSNVWVAGTDRSIARWNGSGWTSIGAPSSWLSNRERVALTGVGEDPWLLGIAGTNFSVHRRSSLGSWVSVDFAEQGAIAGTRAIAAAPTGEVWAVGDSGKVARSESNLAFVSVAVEAVDAPSCTRVSSNGTWAWAVCGSELWQRSPGGDWSVVSGAPVGSTSYVWGFGPNDIWLIRGYQYSRWDGAGWTTLASLPGAYEGKGAWGADGILYVPQNSSRRIAILGAGDPTFVTVGTSGPTYTAVTGVRMADGTHRVWVVGPNGWIGHYDGSDWSAAQRAGSLYLQSVHAYDENNVWAGGNSGAWARFDGSRWTYGAISGASTIFHIFVQSPSSVWALDMNGKLFHWDGTDWALAPDQPTGAKALAGLSDGRMIVVGTAGMQISR